MDRRTSALLELLSQQKKLSKFSAWNISCQKNNIKVSKFHKQYYAIRIMYFFNTYILGTKPFLSKNEELRYLQNISMISTYHLLFMYFLLLFKSKCLQPLVHYYQTPCIIMLARNLILLVTPANGHRPAAPVLQISHICANCTLYNTALSNCTNKGKLLYK